MNTFFDFYTDIDPSKSFQLFDTQHIAAMLLIGFLTYTIIKKCMTLSSRKQELVLKVMAVLVVLLELSHALWLGLICKQPLVKLLPLHLCGMQVIFIPLAVFTKNRYIQEYVYCTSLLGGIAAILFMSGIAGDYPFVHFQTIQSLLYHFLLILVPLIMVQVQGFKPKLKNFPYVLYQFFVVVVLAGIVDYFFGENYLFLSEAPEGTPLVLIEQYFGRAPYLLFTFLLLCLACVFMYKLVEEKKQVAPAKRKKTIYEYSIYEKW